MTTNSEEYEPTEEELDRFVLNKKEEAGIRYKMEKYAFSECFYLTERYADCVKGKWFSVIHCRGDLHKLDACLTSIGSEENFEDLRRDFIRQQLKQRRVTKQEE